MASWKSTSKLLAHGVDGLHAQTFKGFHQLLVYQVHTLAQGFHIVALLAIFQSALHVVYHGKHGLHGLLGTVDDELGFLLDGALAEVLKLGAQTQVLVFLLLQFLLKGLKRILLRLGGFLGRGLGCGFRLFGGLGCCLFCVGGAFSLGVYFLF